MQGKSAPASVVPCRNEGSANAVIALSRLCCVYGDCPTVASVNVRNRSLEGGHGAGNGKKYPLNCVLPLLLGADVSAWNRPAVNPVRRRCRCYGRPTRARAYTLRTRSGVSSARLGAGRGAFVGQARGAQTQDPTQLGAPPAARRRLIRAAAGTSSPPGMGTCRGRTPSGCLTASATRGPSQWGGRTPGWTGWSALRRRWPLSDRWRWIRRTLRLMRRSVRGRCD